MAMLSSVRGALRRRSFPAAFLIRRSFPAVFRAAEEASPGTPHHPRLFSSDASGSGQTALRNSKIKLPSADVEMELRLRHREMEKEYFHVLEEALNTADPAKRNLVLEKHKELVALVREYKEYTRSKPANDTVYLSFGDILRFVAPSFFTAFVVHELMSS